jgi:hypothetical protein
MVYDDCQVTTTESTGIVGDTAYIPTKRNLTLLFALAWVVKGLIMLYPFIRAKSSDCRIRKLVRLLTDLSHAGPLLSPESLCCSGHSIDAPDYQHIQSGLDRISPG